MLQNNFEIDMSNVHTCGRLCSSDKHADKQTDLSVSSTAVIVRHLGHGVGMHRLAAALKVTDL